MVSGSTAARPACRSPACPRHTGSRPVRAWVPGSPAGARRGSPRCPRRSRPWSDREPIRISPNLPRARASASSRACSVRRSGTRTECWTKRDAREIEISSSMTHTGIPCVPGCGRCPAPGCPRRGPPRRRPGRRPALARGRPRDALVITAPSRSAGMGAGRAVAPASRTGPAIVRARARPVYQPPDTKRMIGPKLHAAGAPTKCSPGTDDSIPRPSTG